MMEAVRASLQSKSKHQQCLAVKAGEVWQEACGCNLFVFSDDFDIHENRKLDSGFSMMAFSDCLYRDVTTATCWLQAD